MADLGDVDDVKEAIARLLRGPAFLAKLTEIVVKKGDGIWPPLPADVHEYEQLTLQNFPAAELIAYRSSFSGEMIVQAEHDIGIRWTVVGTSEQIVTLHVERLVRTTSDLLWNETLDTRVNCGPITVSEEDYSPIVPTARHPFMKSGVTLIRVPVWRSN